MARIVVGSYMVRYPLGGMMSYVLQYLRGFQRLGHDVYFVEKAGYADACFDPIRNVMSDDCRVGVRAVEDLLARFGLADRWCFVDWANRYFGRSRAEIEEVFRTADLFLDMGTHGAWLDEASTCTRVLLDGEPGFTQMKMEQRQADGETLPDYDFYYTVGRNIGTAWSTAPAAGRRWRHLWHPVVIEGDSATAAPDGRYTTVMNWQSHDRLEFQGRLFGQKDLEFEKFASLPLRTRVPLEIAVAGKHVPRQALVDAGWIVRSAHEVSVSYDSFREYLRTSRGEFSVSKQVFVATNSGWFSDRTAAYLASGRPAVVEETGFSAHVDCGRGLFAVRTVDEAAAALEMIEGDFSAHAGWAREIAAAYFDAEKILDRFLGEVG